MADEPLRRGAATLAAAAAAGWIGGWPALAAAILSAALVLAGMPLFRRYAMARPNARSSHREPVPQGGGAAVAAAALIMLAATSLALPASMAGLGALAAVAGAVILLALIGAADDIRNLPVLPRLGGQLLAVATAVVALRLAGGPVLPLPLPLELLALTVAGTWFVNLTNFMDGIDGITLAGFMPLAAGAALVAGQAGGGPAAALAPVFLGALAGFVWFNLPKARLFLGDVGSLPIGLIGGALLMDLAQHGAFAAAVILPLYHFTDATTTLLGRLARREKVFEPHRQHAYQRAVDGGWSHGRVSGIVLALDVALVGLALATLGRGWLAQAALVALALLLVAAVILLFRRQGGVQPKG
jgi:UDP-N-acetylmuramyl pentapeptide phosphotransferase/UDP-N-acetylglucosamine-1-phosphate transferase